MSAALQLVSDVRRHDVAIRRPGSRGVRPAAAAAVAAAAGAPQIPAMGAPILDFSHLTPDERIELAEQLWDSPEPADVGPRRGAGRGAPAPPGRARRRRHAGRALAGGPRRHRRARGVIAPPGAPSPGRLFVRPAARRDLVEAFRWYQGRSVGLGHEFLRAVAVTFAVVDRDPERFPVAFDDIRNAVVRRFPYVVYLVGLTGGVSVLAVMHGPRDP
jgi:plasmid stabilization system protein ParE